MERGWIKLWRKLEDSPVFQDEALLKTFIWCLMKANTEKRHIPLKIGKGTTVVPVQQGQFIFGRNTAGKALNMHPETARKRMAKLARLGMLKIESTNQYSLVSLVNWEIYQKKTKKVPTKYQPSTTDKNKEKKELYIQEAKKILSYLNQKRNGKRGYSPNKNNLDPIIARLKDGHSKGDCFTVIDNKAQDQYFIDNPLYMRPGTLFSAKKFESYLVNPPKPQTSSKFSH